MKKLVVFSAIMAMGAGVAFAASVSVPWFVDTAPAANKVPGVAAGVTGIVTLKNTTSTLLTLSIRYFSAEGLDLGPNGADATFTIAANSALAFRPVANDPSSVGGGQESTAAVLVPDRPVDVDTKANGSLTISWTGNSTDVQGQVAYFQTTIDAARGGYVTLSYSHLLPPGI